MYLTPFPRHVYPNTPGKFGPSRELKMAREFPGPDDGRVVAAGHMGAVFMPSGARYLISGEPPRATYLGGGDPALGAFIERNWVPEMSSSQILNSARQFIRENK